MPYEITPRYLTDYRVPFNMWQLMPSPQQAKFILMLRHPTSRTWSAFFQTLKQKDWDNHTFLQQTREEIALLRQCYNTSMGYMAQDKAVLSGTQWPGMNTLHMCKDPRSSYMQFQDCVMQHSPNASHPWFFHYTQFEVDGMPQFSPKDRVRYEGITMRGLYVDQLFNYLCAGFHPQQFLVMTTGE